jgi:hypothetical protein
MIFRFSVNSDLLPAQLFALRYCELSIYSIETPKPDIVEFEVFIDNPVTAYKLGQIMACAVRDFRQLAEKYRAPGYSPDVSEPLKDDDDR